MDINDCNYLTLAQKNKLKAKGYKIIVPNCIGTLRDLVTTGRAEHSGWLKLYADAMGILTVKSDDKLVVRQMVAIWENVLQQEGIHKADFELTQRIKRSEAEALKLIDSNVESIQIDIKYVKDFARLYKHFGEFPPRLGKTAMTMNHDEKLKYFNEIFGTLLKRNKLQISMDAQHWIAVMQRVNEKVYDNWLFQILTNKS